jgi:hypothetical protein
MFDSGNALLKSSLVQSVEQQVRGVHRSVAVWSEELPCKNYPTTGTVFFDYNHAHQEVKFLLTYLVLMLKNFDKIFQCSITLCTQSLNTSEALGCTPTHLRAFKWYRKHCKGYCGLGKLNMTNKQNKSTTLHNR